FGVREQRPRLDEEQLHEVQEFILGMTAPIRSAVSREALERSRREQTELALLCQRISASIELDRLLGVLGEQVLTDELFDGYFVSLPDAAESALICRHIQLPPEFAGMESAYADLRQPLDTDDPLAAAYRDGRRVLVTPADLQRWPELQHRFQRWRIHTAAMLPIRLQRRTIGCV